MTCRGFLQFILKLLNLVLIIVGVIMIAYSLWMLKEWHSHSHPQPKPPTLEKGSSIISTATSFESTSKGLLGGETQEKVPEIRLKRPLLTLTYTSSISDSPFLPAPWFIYTCLGLGILVTLIPFTGYIAAEISNGCCLSCYAVFLGIILLIQAAVAAAIFFDHHWQEDIPKDPTGELEQLKGFVLKNFEICKWVGLGVIIVEALALLFAMILQAIVSNARTGYDSDDDYVAPRSYRQPLLNRQPAQGGNATDSLPQRNNAWTTRLREKYGSNTGQSSTAPSDPNVPQEKGKGACTIM